MATKTQTIAPQTSTMSAQAEAPQAGPANQLAPIDRIRAGLDKMTPNLALALPRHIPVERFKRVVLTALNLKELDQYHEQWDTVTGDPEVWCPLSWDCFVLWPRPSDGGGWLRIDYVAWPQEIDDDEEWDFPDQSQDALVHYALYDSLLKYYDKESADNHLSLFLQQGLQGSNRSGLRKDQAREWGREGFPSLSPAGPSHVRSS